MTATRASVETSEINAVVHEAIDRWAVPGLALGLLNDGEVRTFAYGAANLETGQAVRTDTLFQVGSISKIFTATLIMQLVDEALVDLDTPVIAYLPALRLADEAATRTVTLHHLLTHTSGFYGDRFDDFGYGDDALSTSLAAFPSLRQYTPPGETWAYCNTGFQLSGAVIEAVLGASFETAMRDRILTPLGLDHTFYFAHEVLTRPHAVGHNTPPPPGDDRPNTPEVAREWGRSRCRAAQGGITSNVGDLLTFAAFHMGDGTAGGRRTLISESVRAMQQPLVEAALSPYWGIGWAVEQIDGVGIVGHGGTTNGFQARLTLVPDRDAAFAYLTNSNLGAAAIRSVDTWLLERIAGLQRTEPAPTDLSSEQLAPFVGRYERPGIIAEIAAIDGGLALHVHGNNQMTKEDFTTPPRHARPIGDRTFAILDGEAAGSTFDFILDQQGLPRFLRYEGRLSDRIPSS